MDRDKGHSSGEITMSWEDILKERRLEKLRRVITKYVDARYAESATEGLDESTVNDFIEFEECQKLDL